MVVVDGKAKQPRRVNGKSPRGRCDSTRASETDSVLCSKYLSWKFLFDWMLAAALLLPALPIILVLIVVVRITSPGPGIFRQKRSGKNGKTFTMYKIRTMTKNAEAKTGPVWARIKDSRVTPVGSILRKLHLDELPQLVNVLMGQMSLVGPRPERPEIVQTLSEHISGYKKRLAVRPGITGLAQLNLPPDTDLESVRRKLVLDLEYFSQASLFLDIRIIVCTGLRIFKLPEAFTQRIFGLSRKITHEQLDRHKQPPKDLHDSSCGHPHAKFDLPKDHTLPPELSESMSQFVKDLLNDVEVEDANVQHCIERSMHRSCEAALRDMPADG